MTKRNDQQYRSQPGKLAKAVAEARLQYITGEEDSESHSDGESRLSAKNQLTIPAAMVRALGWRPGDGLALTMQGGGIMLERLPQTPEEWARHLQDALRGVPEWADDEKAQKWLRAERDSWEDREGER